MAGKLTLAVVPLAGCGGCEVRILEALAKPAFRERFEVVYWPLVSEAEMPEEVDLAIVVGAVRVDENIEVLRRVRSVAKKVAAVGSCAVYGGISGQADYNPTRENMVSVYGREVLEKAPRMLDRVYAVADAIPVDYVVPRCPPRPESIEELFRIVLEGGEPRTIAKTVCAECPRRMVEIKKVDESFFKRGLPGPETNPETCLLSQGYLCLGPVTIAGCKAACPRHGIPCFGCAGPAADIAVRRDMDIPVALARFIATLAGMDPFEGGEKVLEILKKVYGLRRFYVFTLESEVFRRKPRGFAIRVLSEKR